MKRVWRKGPPPHVGWWNASNCRGDYVWRWWDGKRWSLAAHMGRSATYASRKARLRGGDAIEWTDYYPADARVPRLDPAEGWLLNTGTMPKLPERIEVIYTDGVRRQALYEAQGFWNIQGDNLDIYAWRSLPV